MEVLHKTLSELVLEFSLDISGLTYTHLLKHLKMSGVPIVDLQFTKDSVAIFLSEPVSSLKVQELILSYASESTPASQLKELKIPVCYGDEYGPDLTSVSEVLELEAHQVIEAHQSSTYTVAMFGFIPGFAYLEGLPRKLQVSRKDTPVKNLHGGSVAIAAHYSAIYPVDAPGGWHVIGRTPLKVVNWLSKEPFLISPENSIRFVSISSEKFQSYVG